MDTTLHADIHDRHDRTDHAETSTRPSVSRVTTIRSTAVSVEPTAFGAGWYHDEAIQQASRDAIEARCNPYA